jgi:acyl-CoA synthetase (AMP-forming)/AMP-acid ligase II
MAGGSSIVSGVGVTIDFGVRASAEMFPDKTALIAGGRSLTYSALVERMNRAGNAAMAGLGLKPGETIILLAPNCLEYIEIVAGISSIGVIVATLNPRLAPREISFIAADCKARAMIVEESLLDRVLAVDLARVETIIVLGRGRGEHVSYEDWIARASAERPALQAAETDTFSLPYTSGTTGKPKGVMVSHRSRVLTFLGMSVAYGGYGPTETYLAVAPLFHGAGFAFAMASPFFGGTCEILPAFEPETVISKLHEGGYSGTFMVPTHFHAVFNLEAAVLERNRGNRLKALVSNAAALAQATKHRIVDYFGDGVLHETYGSTEAAIVTNLRPEDQLRKERCVGLPFTMTLVKLVDKDGNPVARGDVGELYSRSPYLFNGYFGQPEETAKACRDGWVTAGDMARMDEEGYIFLVDRKKDMVITGGINVYPREIEEVLFAHEAIKEAAVIGVPDDYWGEKLVAFVVMGRDGSVEPAALDAFLRDNLATYKVPRDVRFIDALPRNAAGKVVKGELKDMLEGKH